MSLFSLYPGCSPSELSSRLPLYEESLALDRNALMAKIGRKLDDIRALATEEAINAAVGAKTRSAESKMPMPEGEKSTGPCPLVYKMPVELRIKIYPLMLSFEQPVKVIPRRQWFACETDWEAERLKCVRLNVGILFVNKVIHKEALEVFYSLNEIRCHGSDLGTMWFQPNIPKFLSRVEVSFDSLWELAAVRAGVDWPSTVNIHALIRLARDAPRLEKLDVRVDNLIDYPPEPKTLTIDVQDGDWTLSSFLEGYGFCSKGQAECFAMGRWRIRGYPTLEFRHDRIVDFWPLLEDHRIRGGPIFQEFGAWTKDECIAHEMLQNLRKNHGCKCVALPTSSYERSGAQFAEDRVEESSRKQHGVTSGSNRGGHGQRSERRTRHDMFEAVSSTDRCSYECRTRGLCQQLAVIEKTMELWAESDE
ncbi:MAG: hypothetical protein M1822_004197 [Bathelium mastoideum]|nr:MAG: hypothetical protein M1822_004197 [Bathelium mastoideum]